MPEDDPWGKQYNEALEWIATETENIPLKARVQRHWVRSWLSADRNTSIRLNLARIEA